MLSGATWDIVRKINCNRLVLSVQVQVDLDQNYLTPLSTRLPPSLPSQELIQEGTFYVIACFDIILIMCIFEWLCLFSVLLIDGRRNVLFSLLVCFLFDSEQMDAFLNV